MPPDSPPPDGSGPRRLVEQLDRTAEAPVRRAAGSARANPLLHAGTISVFLLVVVVLSGVYITLFFEFGFRASYDSVARLDDHPVQRVVRSVHRYSSAALVVTTVVHAWRIFVAGRFTAGRRFRWVTGMVAVGSVWVAGVTGYALVADQRAQAVGGAVARVLDGTAAGTAWTAGVVRDAADGAGGSGLLLGIWFVHLGITALIGWAVWRHLRRSRQPVVAPRHWMAVMGAGLLVLAIAVPADLLDPADPARLVPDMTLDPFMLFLLPPLRSSSAVWVALLAVAVFVVITAVPWMLRERGRAVVEIDVDKCTGCDLCVVDCPYVALRLDTREDAGPREGAGPVAVVDPAACVGCGICLGSCSFGAMSLAGQPSADDVDCAGLDVVITCRRQARHAGPLGPGEALLELECTGALNPGAIRRLDERGATSIRLVGCGPGECGYGLGNLVTHERLRGTRAPHVDRRHAGTTVESYADLGDLGRATVAAPTPDPDASELPGTRRGRVAAVGIVALSLVGVGAATLLPFAGDGHGAAVRVVIDHAPGGRLEGQAAPSGAPGVGGVVAVRVDGGAVRRSSLAEWDGRLVGVVDVGIAPGLHDVEVVLEEGADRTLLWEGPATVDPGRRLLVSAADAPPPPGVAEGRRVFEESRLGACTICHSREEGVVDVGPSLYGVADRAATTVDGLDAATYLRQSIVDPDAHVVPGFPAGQMLPIYDERLTPDQIDSLVEYLLTLRGVS